MNKTLLKSVREYKKQSILAPLLVILEVLMEVLIPLEMAKIIDVGIANGDMSYILQRGLILVVMAMLALFFGVQAGNMAAIAGAGYARNLRHDIFYKVQDFSFKNIDHFSTSGLVTRMTTDITNIQMAYMMSIRLLARAPFMIILSWIMTLLLNKTISLLFLIVIPLLGGTLIYIAKKAHPHFIKVFDEYDVLNNSVQENVNASRVVKAFVREDYEIDKFHDISKYVYNLFTKAEKIVAWNSPVMQFTMYSVVLIMVLIGGKSIIAGTMETGELTSVIVYALQIIGSLMMVTFVFVMIMIAEASSDRITEVMNEIPEMQDQPDAVTEVPNGDIVFDHVDFSYAGEGGNLSLKDVNLHIESGQTIGMQNLPLSSSSQDFTMSQKDVSKSAALMFVIIAWNPCATRYPWFFRKMYCSLEPFMKTSAGVMKLQAMKKSNVYVSLRRLTDSFRSSRTVTIQKSSREVTMYPVVRSSVCVSQGRSLRNQKS